MPAPLSRPPHGRSLALVAASALCLGCAKGAPVLLTYEDGTVALLDAR